MEKRRTQRLSELLHQELSSILQRRIKDPRVRNVTITRVEVSNDLQHANVFVVTRERGDDHEKKVLHGLQNAGGYIRNYLAANLTLRFVPALHFVYDVNFEKGTEIVEMIDQLFPHGSSDEPEAGAAGEVEAETEKNGEDDDTDADPNDDP